MYTVYFIRVYIRVYTQAAGLPLTGGEKPLLLPGTKNIENSLKILDRIYCTETHKVTSASTFLAPSIPVSRQSLAPLSAQLPSIFSSMKSPSTSLVSDTAP